MKEFLDKISSYHFFNYLLPGILFAYILVNTTTYSFIQNNLIVGAFVYYFIGLVISRFGSLIIEPILKKLSLLKFASYSDFVSASKKDPKLETLSETNNMYRTICSMFILILLLLAYQFVELKFPVIGQWNLFILVVLLLVIFISSYKKQTEYITKRIKANNK